MRRRADARRCQLAGRGSLRLALSASGLVGSGAAGTRRQQVQNRVQPRAILVADVVLHGPTSRGHITHTKVNP